MSREGLRIVGPAVASIAAILIATLVVEWFVIGISGMPELSTITIDLREARACTTAGPCGVVPMSMLKGGLYPTLATITFWGSLLFAALVAIQAFARMTTGQSHEAVAKAGHSVGTVIFLTAVGAGYLFGPEGSNQMMGFGIGIERGWGALVMLLGVLLGHVALYYARAPGLDDPPDPVPYVPRATIASTRVPLPLDTPPTGQPQVRPPTVPPVIARAATPPARSSSPTTPPPIREAPEVVKGKVRFAMVTGEVTVAGIDARREDTTSVLVMWRDVVGLVVRRLPPELGGYPFVDVVSTAGMTLRVLPWSKLTGEAFAGDSEARVRAFVTAVLPRCPEARLDRATQAFLDDASQQPAQLPDLELLAKHDQALA